MGQQARTFSITAPGFMGLNTQDSPVDMDSKFALESNNCVIDKFGRVGARKGWVPGHNFNSTIGTQDVECIGELVEDDATRTILVASGLKLFKLVGSNLVELTYGGGGTPPVIGANNWQAENNHLGITFFQIGHDPLLYEPSLSTTTYRRLSEHPSSAGTPPQANACLAAYGRLWAGKTSTVGAILYWSDTLAHQKWTGGSSGSLNLQGVWPSGGDEIVAIAAHNNNLVIFGSRQILIYTGANNPSTMTLSDAIANCGCVGRDTIQNTPDDLIFLSSGGLRSLRRVIQEKSAPITTASRTVNDDIIEYIGREPTGATIKSVYSPSDSFYLLTFVTSRITYCFDVRQTMQDGSYRVTTWTGIVPKAYLYANNRTLYMGLSGYAAVHTGYSDNGANYTMRYYTSWVDFGDPIRQSILKRVAMTIFGGLTQTVLVKWGFDYIGQQYTEQQTLGGSNIPAEYGVAEYNVGEYTEGVIIAPLSSPAAGAGKVIQIGLECPVSGYEISIQRVDIYTKDGAFL